MFRYQTFLCILVLACGTWNLSFAQCPDGPPPPCNAPPEPRLIAALREHRPPVVQMRFRPCAQPAGAARRECRDAEMPVTYR